VVPPPFDFEANAKNAPAEALGVFQPG